MELFVRPFDANTNNPQARRLASVLGADSVRRQFGQNARVDSDYARMLFVKTPANKRMNQLRADLIWNGGSAGQAIREEIGQLLKNTYGNLATIGSGVNVRPVDLRGSNLQAFRAGWASGLVFSNSTIRRRMFQLVADRKNFAWSRILSFYFQAGIIAANSQAAYDAAIREQGAIFQREIARNCVSATRGGIPLGITASGEALSVCRARVGEEARRNFYRRSVAEVQRRSGAAPRREAEPAPTPAGGGAFQAGLDAIVGGNLVRGSLDPRRMAMETQQRLREAVLDANLGGSPVVDQSLIQQIVREIDAALIEQGGSLCSLDEANFALQLEENLIAFQIPENLIPAYLAEGANAYRQQCANQEPLVEPPPVATPAPAEPKKGAGRNLAIGAGLATAGALAYLTLFRK